jgi:tetratricopeptide (TPR) repeat protein
VFPLLLAVAVAAPNPDRGAKPTLAGQVVLPRDSGAAPAFVLEGPDGQPVKQGTLSGTEWYVVRDEGRRLLVRHLGEDVWVQRAAVRTPAEVIAEVAESLKNDAGVATMYTRLAKAHELLRDWDAAVRAYDDALRVQPRTYAYYNNRANYRSRKRDFERAAADYDESLALSPNAPIPLSNRGALCVTLREYDRAIDFYSRSIEAKPDYARAYAGRANAWREKREYDKALADAERGCDIDPKTPHTLAARGAVRAARGEVDAALADLTTAVYLDPLFASGYYHRAGLFLRRHEFGPAIRDLDTALRVSPTYVEAFVRRAEAWAACGNPRRALADLSDAIATDAKFAPAFRARAWVLATCPDEKVRDGKAAVTAAKTALELWKDPPTTFFEAMAAALAETGDFAGAVEWQTRAASDAGYVKETGTVVAMRLDGYRAKRPTRE